MNGGEVEGKRLVSRDGGMGRSRTSSTTVPGTFKTISLYLGIADGILLDFDETLILRAVYLGHRYVPE